MRLLFRHGCCCLPVIFCGQTSGHAEAVFAFPDTAIHPPAQVRERISINEGWRFMRYAGAPDTLVYDQRPAVDLFSTSTES